MKSWLGAKDVIELLPAMSIRNARKLIKEVRKEMKQEGAYLFETKELLAPRKRIMKKLEIGEEME